MHRFLKKWLYLTWTSLVMFAFESLLYCVSFLVMNWSCFVLRRWRIAVQFQSWAVSDLTAYFSSRPILKNFTEETSLQLYGDPCGRPGHPSGLRHLYTNIKKSLRNHTWEWQPLYSSIQCRLKVHLFFLCCNLMYFLNSF